jgi:hypothetical protein
LFVLLPTQALAEIAIRLATTPSPRVEVQGLPPEYLKLVDSAIHSQGDQQKVVALFVAGDRAASALPVLGDCAIEDGRLCFTPRFPLKPGLKYRAVFDPKAVKSLEAFQVRRIEAVVGLPAVASGQPTKVEAIYPSSDVLPENQLKFYIQFSSPMQRGDSYRHLRLLDEKGAAVEAPYLELAEELWNEAGTRLTLLLDPGRVKHDLKPHTEVGGVLVDGRSYTLQVDSKWRDAHGNSLAGAFQKKFRVAKPDVRQPDQQQWKVTPPRGGTIERLSVKFDEPLDYALVQHAIRVSAADGTALDGQIKVDQNETHWSFEPKSPWAPGRYKLLISSTLEDLAGNSIGRPFEVYLPAAKATDTADRVIEFQVGQPGTVE